MKPLQMIPHHRWSSIWILRYHSTAEADTCIVYSTHWLIYLPYLNSEWKVGRLDSSSRRQVALVRLSARGDCLVCRVLDWAQSSEARIEKKWKKPKLLLPIVSSNWGRITPGRQICWIYRLDLLDLLPPLHCCLHPRLYRIKRVVAEKMKTSSI